MTDIEIRYRSIVDWPGDLTPDDERPTSPFRQGIGDTMGLLRDELRHLEATDATIELAVRENQIRIDGALKADVRPTHPGVILSFGSIHGPLRYWTDRYRDWRRDHEIWWANLRAIAFGLEALRRVERYGIAQRGEQYTGWKELGAGIPMGGAGSSSMTLREAAEILAGEADDEMTFGPEGLGYMVVTQNRTLAAVAWRSASKRLHPDQGGDPEAFKRLSEAKRIVDEHLATLPS